MGGGGAEQGGHRFRSLLAGQPRHLDLAAEKLVFQMEANTIAFMDIVTAGENPLAGGNFINR